MRLIFIYGPPAVGKYTVGRALAELTGYKFFHNHLTVDVARPIFGDVKDEAEHRIELLSRLRLVVFETVARLGINTIFTCGYIPNVGPTFVPDVIKTITAGGGTIHFVRLTAPDKVLFKRVDGHSRHRLHKRTDPEFLKQKLTDYDMHAVIDYPSSIEIDTSALTPQQSARHIIEAFKL